MGKFRSGLEKRNAERLSKAKEPYHYEPFKVRYVQPEKSRLYLPDFVFPNGILIECKGLWEAGDRHKMQWVQDSWPDLDIRFVFSNAHARIRKGSKTTYAHWCEKKGWRWAHKHIPLAWVREPANKASQRAINEILKDPINRR